MSNVRLARWIKLAILGGSLHLSGCSSTALTEAPDAPPRFAAAMSQAPEVNLVQVAERLRANGDAANAAALFHQAHLANPQWAVPLVSLGDTLMEIGAHADAAEAYAKALAIEPKNRDALRGLGISRVLEAQPRFAIHQFESALAIDAADVKALNGLGVALDMTGDHRAAQKQYQAALAIEPRNAKLLNNLALSLALSGDSGQAVAILERVNAAPAASALTRQNLALAYGLSGRLGAAARIARIDLDEPAVRRNLAFYAAHGDLPPGHGLAQTIGVQRNGVRYAASPPPPAPDLNAGPPPELAEPPASLSAPSVTVEPLAPAPPMPSPTDDAAVGKPTPLIAAALAEMPGDEQALPAEIGTGGRAGAET